MGGRDWREVSASPGAPGAPDAGSGRKEPPRTQPCPDLDFGPWERIRFCAYTAQDSNTAPLSGNLPVLPQKPQDPEASTATATAAVRGGQAALAAVAPRCRRKALLGGATRPLAPPTGLHCPREGDGRASCPRQKGQPGGGGPAVSARGPPTHQIIQGSDPS